MWNCLAAAAAALRGDAAALLGWVKAAPQTVQREVHLLITAREQDDYLSLQLRGDTPAPRYSRVRETLARKSTSPQGKAPVQAETAMPGQLIMKEVDFL